MRSAIRRASASGIGAAPDVTVRTEVRSRCAASGCASRAWKSGGAPEIVVARWVSTSARKRTGSKRSWTMLVAPDTTATPMPPIVPIAWNHGATAIPVPSPSRIGHSSAGPICSSPTSPPTPGTGRDPLPWHAYCRTLVTTLAWVSTTPLGLPVVPPV